MSFIEFLLEYYIYILAVLVIIIVGVIGFLVDSKNKDKNKVDVSSSNNSGQNVGISNENSVSQTNLSVTNEPVNSVTLEMEPQNVNDIVNTNNNLNEEVSLNVNTNTNVVNGGPSVENNDINNVLREQSNEVLGEQVMSSNIANMVISQGVKYDNAGFSIDNGPINNLNNSVMNGIENVQATPTVEVNQMPVSSNINPVNVQNQMVNAGNLSGDILNQVPNSAPVQPAQTPINVSLNEMPVQSLYGGISNVSNLNTSNDVVYQQNIQPAMPINNNVSPLDFDMMPSNNVGTNQNIGVQNQMMGMGMPNSMNVQNNMEFNQNMVPNNGVQYMNPLTEVPHNSNMVSQTSNMGSQNLNNNMAINNTVVTSEGAQPFDISSMFANNK